MIDLENISATDEFAEDMTDMILNRVDIDSMFFLLTHLYLAGPEAREFFKNRLIQRIWDELIEFPQVTDETRNLNV